MRLPGIYVSFCHRMDSSKTGLSKGLNEGNLLGVVFLRISAWNKRNMIEPSLMEIDFNPSSQEAERQRQKDLSLRSYWSPGRPGLQRETPSQEKKKKERKGGGRE